MAEQNGTPQSPDSVITTQRDGQTIVAELFFNHSGTETFRDKLLKVILADKLAGRSRAGKNENHAIGTARTKNGSPGRFYLKIPIFPKSRAGKIPSKMPLSPNEGAERRVYANRASQAKKGHRHLVDEKDPLIHIRTHNTDLKKRLAAYAEQHPDVCRQTDADPETGCMEFDIEKGRFSFRLTAPYSEERREAARRYARESTSPTG